MDNLIEFFLCHGCECATTNPSNVFIKRYKNTAFCLCRKCTEKLRIEIDEFLKAKMKAET